MSGGVKDCGSRSAGPGPPPTSPGFWLAMVSFVALVVATQFVPVRPAPLMRGLAVALLFVAVPFAGLPVLQRRRHGATPDRPIVTRQGLYAVVRHPQYLGLDLLTWGLAILGLYWGTVLPAIAFTVGLSLQARAEEEYLLEHWGDEYRTYRQTVPRFGLVTGLVRYLRRRRGAAPTA